MDEKERAIQKRIVMQELQWVKYRSEMLDIIEGKLIQMKAIAEQVQNEALDEVIRNDLNKQFQGLTLEVKELDQESRKYEFDLYYSEH